MIEDSSLRPGDQPQPVRELRHKLKTMSSGSNDSQRGPIRPYEVICFFCFFALALVIVAIRVVSLFRWWVPPSLGLEDLFYMSPWTLTVGLLVYGCAVLSMRSMSRVLRGAILALMLGFAAYFGGVLIFRVWAMRNARTSFSLEWLPQKRDP